MSKTYDVAEETKSLYTLKRKNNFYRMLMHPQNSNEYHSHDFFEFVYVVDGECTHILNGTHTTIKKGDYFIIDYNSVHCYVTENDEPRITIIDLLFIPQFIDNTIKNCNSFKNLLSGFQFEQNINSLKFNPVNYIFHDKNDAVKQLLFLMLEEEAKNDVNSMDISRHLLSSIFLIILRELSDNNAEENNKIIKYIIDACHNRYAEKKLLDTLCKELHYSKPYLSSLFKKELNKNFRDYLVDVRIDKACRFLHNTDKKINEISTLVGYDDVAFFISTFKAKTNLTPTEFRKTVKSPINMGDSVNIK